MLPQFICELGVLFFYFSLLAKPATANIKPISPIPVVMYAKLPDHETSKQMANKRMAMPNPIFFIRSHPVSNWIYLFCQIGIGLLILFSNDCPNPPTNTTNKQHNSKIDSRHEIEYGIPIYTCGSGNTFIR